MVFLFLSVQKFVPCFYDTLELLEGLWTEKLKVFRSWWHTDLERVATSSQE